MINKIFNLFFTKINKVYHQNLCTVSSENREIKQNITVLKKSDKIACNEKLQVIDNSRDIIRKKLSNTIHNCDLSIYFQNNKGLNTEERNENYYN